MAYNPCFLIPCYNHGETLPSIVKTLGEYGLPCLLIDDGSEPATSSILDDLTNQHDWLMLHRHEQNQGKGGAVMTGMREAWKRGHSHVIQIDADGQHDLSDLQRVIRLSNESPDALISGRPIFDASVPKSRLFGRYLTHFWVWIETLSLTIQDSMCGFRAYPLASCVSLINEEHLGRRMDFDVEVMVRLYWRGVQIKFFDTKVIYPQGGKSHFKILRDNLLISWMHTRLFFGMLAHLPRLLWQKTTRTSHWSKTKERGTSLGLRFMLNAYRVAGRGVFNLLLYPVIGYFWLTGKQARAASKQYLTRLQAYAKDEGLELPENLDSFSHFLRFGHSILDKAAAWIGDIRFEDVNFPEIDLYRQVVESKKGVLIIGSHLGNLELCRALGDKVGDVKINSIVFTHHAKQFNHVLKSINPRANINLIQVTEMGPDTAIMLDQKIESGEWVVIVADRIPLNMKDKVVWANFLGSKAAFPQGPFVLASLLKCPVYLMFGIKEMGQYTVHFESFSEQIKLPRAKRTLALESVAQKYASRLETYCLISPLDWFNFFDFWKR